MNQNKTEEKTTDALNDLLTRAYDAEQGFQHAADAVEHPDLKSLLNEYSAQRRTFGGEIKALTRALGGEPDKGASLTGKIHQLWIDIVGKLAGEGGESTLLDECQRGEEKTMETYREKLRDSELHPEAHSLISRQLEDIQQIYNRLKSLELAAERMEKAS